MGRRMKLNEICSDPNVTGTGKVEFITPKWLTDALGPFDVDICAAHGSYNKIGRRKNYYGPPGSRDCGLAAKLKPSDFVWCNPPFGVKNGEAEFIRKMSEHNNGICLTQCKVSSAYFHDFVWPNATGIFFFRGGLTFEDLNGAKVITFSGLSPAILIAFGGKALTRIQGANLRGQLVMLQIGGAGNGKS